MSTLKIASCQFPVSESVDRNLRYITRYTRKAAQQQADIVLFPETALTGWQPNPVRFANVDKVQTRAGVERAAESAKENGIWVALGAYHFFSSRRKPTNCLYLISPKGKIADRYDKRKLFGRESKSCSAGTNRLVKTINGHRCGFLICNDSNHPELYREYQKERVAVLLHPLCAVSPDGGPNALSRLTEAQFLARAWDHQMHIVASNSSANYSNIPASVIRPDGTRRALARHVPGILVHSFPEQDPR